MRLQSFLLNEGRSKGISIEDTKQYLEKNCSDAVDNFNKGYKLFRGYYGDTDEFMFLDPTKGKPRKSAYAEYNYYTLFIDNLSSWKKYPKRSRGIVCTSSYAKSSHYSDNGDNVYIVFPFNGSKIAVCPTDDIFQAFKIYKKGDIGPSGSAFNRKLEQFFMIYSKTLNASKNWSTLKKAMKIFDEYFLSINNQDAYKSIQNPWNTLLKKHYKAGKEGMMKMWDKLLSPVYNNFVLTKNIRDIPNNREVWTDGKCVLIKADSVDMVLGGVDYITDTNAADDVMHNVSIERISCPEDILFDAFGERLTYNIQHKIPLPNSLDVALDAYHPEKGFIVINLTSALALVGHILKGNKKIDIDITRSYNRPFDLNRTTNVWKYQKNKKYKGLEEISDIRTLEMSEEDIKVLGI